MPEYATKEDVSASADRIIGLMRELFSRMDDRFSALEKKVDTYALRGEVRLRDLEFSDSGAKERMALLEKHLDSIEKRVEKLERKSGEAA